MYHAVGPGRVPDLSARKLFETARGSEEGLNRAFTEYVEFVHKKWKHSRNYGDEKERKRGLEAFKKSVDFFFANSTEKEEFTLTPFLDVDMTPCFGAFGPSKVEGGLGGDMAGKYPILYERHKSFVGKLEPVISKLISLSQESECALKRELEKYNEASHSVFSIVPVQRASQHPTFGLLASLSAEWKFYGRTFISMHDEVTKSAKIVDRSWQGAGMAGVDRTDQILDTLDTTKTLLTLLRDDVAGVISSTGSIVQGLLRILDNRPTEEGRLLMTIRHDQRMLSDMIIKLESQIMSPEVLKLDEQELKKLQQSVVEELSPFLKDA